MKARVRKDAWAGLAMDAGEEGRAEGMKEQHGGGKREQPW